MPIWGMATSAATLLDEIDAAISACLTSQAYTVRGRSQQRAQLAQLMDARDRIKGEIKEATANSGSMCTVAQVRGPS